MPHEDVINAPLGLERMYEPLQALSRRGVLEFLVCFPAGETFGEIRL